MKRFKLFNRNYWVLKHYYDTTDSEYLFNRAMHRNWNRPVKNAKVFNSANIPLNMYSLSSNSLVDTVLLGTKLHVVLKKNMSVELYSKWIE